MPGQRLTEPSRVQGPGSKGHGSASLSQPHALQGAGKSTVCTCTTSSTRPPERAFNPNPDMNSNPDPNLNSVPQVKRYLNNPSRDAGWVWWEEPAADDLTREERAHAQAESSARLMERDEEELLRARGPPAAPSALRLLPQLPPLPLPSRNEWLAVLAFVLVFVAPGSCVTPCCSSRRVRARVRRQSRLLSIESRPGTNLGVTLKEPGDAGCAPWPIAARLCEADLLYLAGSALLALEPHTSGWSPSTLGCLLCPAHPEARRSRPATKTLTPYPYP